MRRMTPGRGVYAMALAVVLAGCGGGPEVVRVVDGRLVGGAYVEPEAYASFLRGAVAEEQGDLRAALAAYEETAQRDAGDPEVWTRIGEVRCKMSPADGGADSALARVLSIDGSYSPAWEARARCASLRETSSAPASIAASRRAAETAPGAIGPQIDLARADETVKKSEAARDRLVALTLVHRESVAAWEALAAWARVHDAPMLVARALGETVRRAPAKRKAVAERAVEMAGEGELVAARVLAAAAVDADGLHVTQAAARLAIDDAIVQGDIERVRLRATRGHVGLDEAAARAFLLGAKDMARALAQPLADADSAAAAARMVLASVARADSPSALGRTFEGARAPTGPLPLAALVPFVGMLADTAGAEAARSFADRIRFTRPEGSDAILARASADLAARGLVDDASLPLDARIELAARRRVAPPEPKHGEADARHRLLALALLRPTDPETLALGRRLASASARDALIAAALAKIALARGTSIDAREAARLVALDPEDAIAAAAALDVAKKRGDEQQIAPARARLTALARTPAERELVR